MSNRHKKIGIKHVIRLEWMDKTLDMVLAGMSKNEIRDELNTYLADKKQSGGTGTRGKKTYIIAISILMQTWCNPDKDTKPFRDAALNYAKKNSDKTRLPLHWAMISAAYPFWAGVAKQIGRLLNLQDQITKKQIIQRLKEQYGDRQTISRYARYVIRSFVAWDILKDTSIKGIYAQNKKDSVEQNQTLLLVESLLLASPESSLSLKGTLNSPTLFPFQTSPITAGYVQKHCSRINVNQFSPGEEMINMVILTNHGQTHTPPTAC
ncbi:MAG: hypothetical protein PF690_09760 [Deltaproteobacteria bacterium]|jgi:hypothetical protein|nr:hypothetical protein [Deltaproteobacteria bacterium]